MAHCPLRADAFSAGFVFNVCSSVWIFAFAAVGRAPPSWAAPFRGVLKGFGRSLREENLLCGTRGSPSRAQGPRPPNGCDVGSPRAPRSGPAGLSCSRPARCGPQSAAAAPGRPVWTGRTSGHTLPRGAAQMPTECRTRTGGRSVSEDRHGQTSLPPVRGAAGREAEAPPQSRPLGHVEGEHGGAGCGGLDRGARRVVASPPGRGSGDSPDGLRVDGRRRVIHRGVAGGRVRPRDMLSRLGTEAARRAVADAPCALGAAASGGSCG